MGKSKEVKTNAMRILERNKIPYKEYTYECDEFVDALKVADTLGQPYELLYKTLVTIGNSRNYFVFVIPIAEELDMKKAAKSVGEKIRFHDPCQRYQSGHRLYPRRLYGNRHEKAVCDEN